MRYTDWSLEFGHLKAGVFNVNKQGLRVLNDQMLCVELCKNREKSTQNVSFAV